MQKNYLPPFSVSVCFDNDQAGIEGVQRFADAIHKDIITVRLKNYNDLTEALIQNENLSLIDKNEFVMKRIIFKKKFSSRVKLLSASEIQKLEIPDLQWIVEELIPEGLTILAGKPKSGKSWLALGLSLCVSRGVKFLNKFDTEQKAILYLALEDNHRRIKDRINNILRMEEDKECAG